MLDTQKNAKVAALACIRCGTAYDRDIKIDARGCPSCHDHAPSNLEVIYSAEAMSRRKMPVLSGNTGLSAFAEYLPLDAEDMINLGEGHTPLIAAPTLGKSIGIDDLWVKDESRNPTWSHKDRFSAIAVALAKRQGRKFIATASSGNAGASLAAYAAKAGMRCLVVTFAGAPGPVVEQIGRYGAIVVELADKTMRWPLLAEGVERFGWFVTSPFCGPVVGSHPYGIEGYKTAAYEIVAQSDGHVPDWVVVPAAYGDNMRGIWRGFRDLFDAGLVDRMPKMVAAEIYGSVKKTLAIASDAMVKSNVPYPTQALSIGTTQGTFQSLATLRESSGAAETVAEDAMWEARNRLAESEGIFGELSSVTPIAAAAQLREAGVIKQGDRVVCVMTASGLKDIDQQPKHPRKNHPVENGLDEVLGILRSELGSAFAD